MVSKSTNTTYSGSASLKAMQEWYTMQDVIDTVGGGGGTPTLQQVTDAGSETTNTITINPVDQTALEITGADGYDTITVNSTNGAGIVISSNGGDGIAAYSDVGYGGSFSSNESSAIAASSVNGSAVYATALGPQSTMYVTNGSTGPGIQIETGNGYALNAYSGNGIAVYANAEGIAPTVYVNAGGDGTGILIETGEVGLDVSSQNNNAISAYSAGSTAIYANSPYSTAIEGHSNDGTGVYGYSLEGSGIYGVSTNSDGVVGSSTDGFGVRGYSTNGFGVYGTSIYGPSVYGTSANGVGGFFSSGSTYSLVAQQSAAKPGGGSWSAYSDSRVKKNVKPYTKGLNEILLVNPVNYEYNGLADTVEGTEYTGVIAQEIKEIFPETVSTYKAKLNKEDEEPTELYDFTSTALTFALINAIKELKAEIDLLKAK